MENLPYKPVENIHDNDYRKALAMILGFQEGYPVIACYRIDNQLTFMCPFCGQRHWHGGGKSGEPGAGDGHRVAHCLWRRQDNDKGYFLREVVDWRLSGYLPVKLRPKSYVRT